MRIVAIILNVICLIYVAARLVADVSDYYFDIAGFYLLLCLCFIVNLIVLQRRKKARVLWKNKERDEKQGQEWKLMSSLLNKTSEDLLCLSD